MVDYIAQAYEAGRRAFLSGNTETPNYERIHTRRFAERLESEFNRGVCDARAEERQRKTHEAMRDMFAALRNR